MSEHPSRRFHNDFGPIHARSNWATLFKRHDDVVKWKHIPRYWPLVRRIHRSPVNSPHKGQWRGASTFSLICTRINGWVNNREAGDLRRHHARYYVTVMNRWFSRDIVALGVVALIMQTLESGSENMTAIQSSQSRIPWKMVWLHSFTMSVNAFTQ